MAPTGAAQVLAPRVRRALHQIGSPRVTMAEVRAFIALADAGSYVGARILTGLSQPSLRRAVRHLPVAVRRNLRERPGRGLDPTAAWRRTRRGWRPESAAVGGGIGRAVGVEGGGSDGEKTGETA